MEGKILKVFDTLRRKYVALTPEEYVRQHFTAWMTGDLGYPASLMNNEVPLILNGTRRRCDTVVFRSDGSPSVIVEYKAPTVAITQKVFDQIARYNMVLHSRYLIVSNGLQHFCCSMDYEHDTYSFLRQIPVWSPEI
ncbi:MAG: type I restriction enzyme HsdR N-terminal domain-containing protein [Muribaculaceae bacterium]|nr:type I restriction enzyme HsdR N-terminal domain-containing protein [Muribaculaceae bacterium]